MRGLVVKFEELDVKDVRRAGSPKNQMPNWAYT